jgi:hypothetical protein
MIANTLHGFGSGDKLAIRVGIPRTNVISRHWNVVTPVPAVVLNVDRDRFAVNGFDSSEVVHRR